LYYYHFLLLFLILKNTIDLLFVPSVRPSIHIGMTATAVQVEKEEGQHLPVHFFASEDVGQGTAKLS